MVHRHNLTSNLWLTLALLNVYAGASLPAETYKYRNFQAMLHSKD